MRLNKYFEMSQLMSLQYATANILFKTPAEFSFALLNFSSWQLGAASQTRFLQIQGANRLKVHYCYRLHYKKSLCDYESVFVSHDFYKVPHEHLLNRTFTPASFDLRCRN